MTLEAARGAAAEEEGKRKRQYGASRGSVRKGRGKWRGVVRRRSRGWFCLNSISLMALFMHHLHPPARRRGRKRNKEDEEKKKKWERGGWKTWK